MADNTQISKNPSLDLPVESVVSRIIDRKFGQPEDYIEAPSNNLTHLTMRQRTRTSPNRIHSKIKRYELRNRWKRKRNFLAISHHGTVLGNQSCTCDASADVNDTAESSYKRYHKALKEPVMENISELAINPADTDCWFANYFSGPNQSPSDLRGSGSGCD